MSVFGDGDCLGYPTEIGPMIPLRRLLAGTGLQPVVYIAIAATTDPAGVASLLSWALLTSSAHTVLE